MDPLVGAASALCLVIVILVILIATYQVRRQRRHRSQLHQWADRNGWSLTTNPAVDWGRHLPGGNRRGIGHLLSGTFAGRTVQVAEYSVTDGSDGTTTNTHHYVVTVVPLRHPLPSTEALTYVRRSGSVPLSWNVHGQELFCYRPGRLNPEQIQNDVSQALRLSDLLAQASH